MQSKSDFTDTQAHANLSNLAFPGTVMLRTIISLCHPYAPIEMCKVESMYLSPKTTCLPFIINNIHSLNAQSYSMKQLR